jgi:hypothetical protein
VIPKYIKHPIDYKEYHSTIIPIMLLCGSFVSFHIRPAYTYAGGEKEETDDAIHNVSGRVDFLSMRQIRCFFIDYFKEGSMPSFITLYQIRRQALAASVIWKG